MQIVKSSLLLLTLALAALFMPHARATCSTPDMPKLINVASVSVSTTLAVGATIPGSEQHVHVAGSCNHPYESGMEIIACYYGNGAEIPGLPGVYDSGVPGIGVALRNAQGERITGGGKTACDSRSTPIGYISNDGLMTFDFSVMLELVKTSEAVQSGTLAQDQTKFGIGVYGNDGIGSPNTVSYAGNVNFNPVTCSVSPESLTVTLGNFPLSAFSGTGSETTPETFDVNVNCNNTVQPQVMIASANGYETQFPGVIKLTQEEGVATGVGVKMLVEGQPATFETYRNTSRMAQANETLAIPFQVSYEQTGPQVTPGAANTIATITLGYK